jgi:lambda repressor-like predicted transcriptional regulator
MVDTFAYAGDITRRVRAAIKTTGMTVPALARVTGIPELTLRSRLTGAREFGFSEIALIARALDVLPSELTPDDFKAEAA